MDGNFAIARTEGVNFSVTKSDKSLFNSAINGEGLVNQLSEKCNALQNIILFMNK